MSRRSSMSVWLLAGALAALPAAASSHREAIATLNDPCIDNTDFYAWVTPGTHDKLYLIIGLQRPARARAGQPCRRAVRRRALRVPHLARQRRCSTTR